MILDTYQNVFFYEKRNAHIYAYGTKQILFFLNMYVQN